MLPDIQTDVLLEKFIYKVNAKGKKRKKLSCPPGYHPNSAGTACVPMTATMKTHLKLGSRVAKRTKKAGGIGFIKRTVRKMKKAMKFRKAYGL